MKEFVAEFVEIRIIFKFSVCFLIHERLISKRRVARSTLTFWYGKKSDET
jgi:hypothetical protein